MTQTTLNIPQRTAELLQQLPLPDQQTILKFTEFLLAQHQAKTLQTTVLNKPHPTVDEILDELAHIHEAEPTEFEETIRIDRPNPLIDDEAEY
jgi:hypothetical protein